MPIIITGRHRPHEVLLLVFSALVGAAFLAGVEPPASVAHLLPMWARWTWYLLLLGSGLLGLASFAISDPYRTLVLEQAAMVGQTAAPVVYGVALIAAGQISALFAGALVTAWGAASAWRGWQVSRSIRLLRSGVDQ